MKNASFLVILGVLVFGLMIAGCNQVTDTTTTTTATTTTTTSTIAPPSSPTGLAVNASTGNTIELIWQPTSESNLGGYNLYRSTVSGSGYSKIATVKIGTSYWDTGTAITTTSSSARIPHYAGGSVLIYPTPYNPGVDGNSTIQYSLTADMAVSISIYNILGNIVWSSSYTAGATGGASGYNKITWDGRDNSSQSLPNGIYPIKVSYGSTSKGGFILLWDASSSLTNGTRYYYAVKALNTSAGESGYSNEVSAEAISSGITRWQITIEAGSDPADPIYEINFAHPGWWSYVTE